MSKISTSYSISLDDGCVILAQARKQLNKTNVSILAKADSVEDEFFKAAWASAQYDMNRGTAIWAHPLSASKTLFRKILTPFVSERKAKEVLPSLLDVQLPFNLEDAMYEIEGWAKSPSGTLEATVTAVRNHVLEEELDDLQKTFVETPHRVVHEMLPLKELESVDESFHFEDKHLLVLFRSTHISVMLLEGKQPGQVWVRRTESGECPDIHPLLERINRRLQQLEITSLGVTFLGFKMPEEEDELSLLHSLDVEKVVSRVKQPTSALAACVVFNYLNPDPVGNLRTQTYAHPQSTKVAETALKSQRYGLLAVSGLFMIACFLWTGVLNKIESVRRTALLELAQDLAPNRRIQPGLEVVTVERQLEASQEQRELVLWMAQGGAVKVLNMISESGLGAVMIDELTLVKEELMISGFSKDEESVHLLESKINDSGWLTSLNLTPDETGHRFELRGQP